MRRSLRSLLDRSTSSGHGYAYLDDAAKREVRRALLKAVCLPGRPVPFASRDMPVARGWGSGGLQVTLSTLEPADVVEVVDQGAGDSLNAVALRHLVRSTTGIRTTTDAREATLIQTRHRVPAAPLREGQVLVFHAGDGPLPVPDADVPRLHRAPFLSLFAAGTDRIVYAVPPYTDVDRGARAVRP
jgi:alpha-D-ribose 1-methylphosphonate 5-phosphate C-P lyase